jgi:acyl-CoA thioesterase
MKAMDDVYKYPLKQTATDLINRVLRGNVSDEQLAEIVIRLREEDKFSMVHVDREQHEPRLICSMGLFSPGDSAY